MSAGRTISFYVTWDIFQRMEHRIKLEGVRRNKFLVDILLEALDTLRAPNKTSRRCGEPLPIRQRL